VKEISDRKQRTGAAFALSEERRKQMVKRSGWTTTALLGVALVAPMVARPALAENKDMIRLQAQVQALQDAVARLQQSNDERMGVLKDLVQQTSDAVNKMTVAVNGLKLQMDNNAAASEKRNDALAGQIQSLNDSLDELKARMARMEKALSTVQDQQSQMSATIANLPQPGAVAPANAPAPAAGGNVPTQPGSPLPMPDNAVTPPGKAARLPAPAAGPSSGEMYRTAYSDYMAGKQTLAAQEFGDLIKAYPDDNLAGNAYFYLGEMDLRTNKPSAAIKNYDQVMERYPNNAKIPAAHLHKAQALAETKQPEAAQRELRALIARFPASPEAAQAKVRLAALQRR
jgi:tol-pal system protein YbgF